MVLSRLISGVLNFLTNVDTESGPGKTISYEPGHSIVFYTGMYVLKAKTQVRLCINAQSDQSLHRALWEAKDLKCLQADSES